MTVPDKTLIPAPLLCHPGIGRRARSPMRASDQSGGFGPRVGLWARNRLC